MYGQRDDILADSRRPGGASRDIRLTDNTYVRCHITLVGFCRLFKEVETSVPAGESFEFRLENHKRLAIHHKTELGPVPKIDDAPEAIPDSAKARNEELRRQIPGDGRHDPRACVVHSAG